MGTVIEKLRNGLVFGLAVAAILVSSTTMPATTYASPADADMAPASDVDSKYGFRFSGWFQQLNTAYRPKDTSWSTYLRIDSRSGATMRLYVDGAYDSSGNGYNNYTVGGYVTSPGPGKYEIHNYVYENGRRWARLGASSDNGPGSLYGFWSPDCSGNYADLN